jgi:hypothetical protein
MAASAVARDLLRDLSSHRGRRTAGSHSTQKDVKVVAAKNARRYLLAFSGYVTSAGLPQEPPCEAK